MTAVKQDWKLIGKKPSTACDGRPKCEHSWKCQAGVWQYGMDQAFIFMLPSSWQTYMQLSSKANLHEIISTSRTKSGELVYYSKFFMQKA